MYTYFSQEPIQITTQEQLSNIFRTDTLFLDKNSSLKLQGTINLQHNVTFSGQVHLGDSTHIHSGSTLNNVKLGRNNVIRSHSILNDLEAENDNLFGPFCFIRDNCTVISNNILGAHVEAARSHFESNIKVSHRAFIGDAFLGSNSIIGAGTVFCNFDGKMHQRTAIANNVTIGSGSLLVAPLKIAENTVIAAGSVVTTNLPANIIFVQKRGPLRITKASL